MKKPILFVIVLGLAVLVYIKFHKEPVNNDGSNQVACTMEAKLCPDGSYVGRIGPKCEFKACPTSQGNNSDASSPAAAIGQTIVLNGVSITPLALVQDSRCPAGVYCIQAGTVQVSVNLKSVSETKQLTLTLNSPTTFSGHKVILESVEPAKFPQKVLAPADYSFTFSVAP